MMIWENITQTAPRTLWVLVTVTPCQETLTDGHRDAEASASSSKAMRMAPNKETSEAA